MQNIGKFIGKPRTLFLCAAMLALGGGIGAGAVLVTRPDAVMAPARVVPIASLPAASSWPGEAIVTVRGKVAEIYGDRFILSDGSGRALVDTGRGGAGVAAGQSLTVQGRADHGAIRADFLVDANGRVTAVDRHGRRHGHGHGRRGDHDQWREGGLPPATGG